MGWIAWDLDGTLAQWGTPDPKTRDVHYDVTRVGTPIPAMIDKLKAQLAEGRDCRIFTARVGPATEEECLHALAKVTEGQAAAVAMPPFIPERMNPRAYWEEYQRSLIERWCLEHIGHVLPITATKDFHLWQLWDDRAIQVVSNAGYTLQELYQTVLQEIALLVEQREGLEELAEMLRTPPTVEPL